METGDALEEAIPIAPRGRAPPQPLAYLTGVLFLAGAIGVALFAAYVALDSTRPWYTPESTAVVLSTTFLAAFAIALFAVAWSLVVLPASLRGHFAEDPALVEALEASSEAVETTSQADLLPAKRSIGGVFVLAATVAATSIYALSGATWAPTAWYALNNGVVMFSLLETIVLLAFGLPQLYFASTRLT